MNKSEDEMKTNGFEFLDNVSFKNPNNRNELKEALMRIEMIKTFDDIECTVDLRECLSIVLSICSECKLKTVEMRKILRFVRALWFLGGMETDELSEMYNEFLTARIAGTLKDIYQENDLEKSDLQMIRCNFLIILFSYSYDDRIVLGICKYDYLFVAILDKMIIQLVEQMIDTNTIKADNLYRFIFLMDKITSNWLDIVEKIDFKQYNQILLETLKNNLCTLTDKCKDRYKLISVSLGTIVSNVQLLMNKLVQIQ